jgi:threonyl-tRNA synthetase
MIAVYDRLAAKSLCRFWLFKNIIYKTATRPEKRIGSEESWDKAEHALMPKACERLGANSSTYPG